MEMKNMMIPKGKQETIVAEAVKESPRYPYGLNLRLENEAIDKLGIKEMPEVGEEVMVMAKAKVESCSMNEQSDGKKYRTISLQITDMMLHDVEEKMDHAKALYGEK